MHFRNYQGCLQCPSKEWFYEFETFDDEVLHKIVYKSLNSFREINLQCGVIVDMARYRICKNR